MIASMYHDINIYFACFNILFDHSCIDIDHFVYYTLMEEKDKKIFYLWLITHKKIDINKLSTFARSLEFELE